MSWISDNHRYEPEDFIPKPKQHYDTVKGYIDQFKLVGELLDPDTRAGAGLKAFMMAGQTIADKLFGSYSSWHPFFSYHEKHVELLAAAINASQRSHLAVAEFQRAMEAAAATGRIHSLMKQFAQYGVQLCGFYENTLMPNLMMGKMHQAGEIDGFEVMKQTGQFPPLLPIHNIATLAQWRHLWWGLHLLTVGMFAMVGSETELARQAIKSYNKRIHGLKSSDEVIDRVAGMAAERHALEAQAHALLKASPGAQRAILEPVNFSADNAKFVRAIAWTIARAGDMAQGKIVEADPEAAALAMEKAADRLKRVADL